MFCSSFNSLIAHATSRLRREAEPDAATKIIPGSAGTVFTQARRTGPIYFFCERVNSARAGLHPRSRGKRSASVECWSPPVRSSQRTGTADMHWVSAARLPDPCEHDLCEHDPREPGQQTKVSHHACHHHVIAWNVVSSPPRERCVLDARPMRRGASRRRQPVPPHLRSFS